MNIRKNICALIISLSAALCVAGCDGALFDITSNALRPFGALWARSVTSGTDQSSFSSVAVGADGSLYAAGYLRGNQEYDFGNRVTVSGACGTDYNTVIVKYSSSGKALWARSVTSGTDSSSFKSVAVGADGYLYAAGSIHGAEEYNFGDGVTVSGASTIADAVIVKYSIDGTALWARSVTTGTDSSFFSSVAVGADGYLYAAGYIRGQEEFNFGNGVTVAGTCDSNPNVVIVKYSADGTALWARSVTTGSDTSSFSSVAVGADGSLYAAGSIRGTGEYNFGDGVTVSGAYVSGLSPVIVKYSIDGIALWAKSVTTGPDSSYFNTVAVGADGSLYATGYIYGTEEYNFGDTEAPVIAAGTCDSDPSALIVKYSSSGTALWARSVTTGPDTSSFSSVAVGADGSLYAAGYMIGTEEYNFGDTEAPVIAAGTCDSFYNGTYVKFNPVLVKYSIDGTAKWAKSVTSGTGGSSFNEVVIGADGSVYVAGCIYYAEEYNFGNGVTVSGGYDSGRNALLIKYK